MKRKIIQLQQAEDKLFALCNDGTLWRWFNGLSGLKDPKQQMPHETWPEPPEWRRCYDIPQDK